MTVSRKAGVWGVTWGSAVVLSAGALVYAFNPQPDPPGHYFGALGLVAGQGLSLNVANRAFPTDQFPPDPCRASLRIVNASGRVVARHAAVVMAGETVSLTFTADPPGAADPPGVITADPPGEHRAGEAVPPIPDRQLLRALVLFKGESRQCLSSVEVTNRAGQTTGFMNPGTLVGFNPQPDPPGLPATR